MPRSSLLIAAFASAALLLVGCATTDSSIEDAYVPPTGKDVAHIKGSTITEGGLFGNVHHGYVIMIDLKSIPDPAGRIDDLIPLAPGNHIIAAEYRYSNFMARAYLSLDAQAGVTYQLMIKNGHENTPDARPTSDFWIENTATHKPVTQVYRRQASGGKKGTIFNVNK